MNEFDEITAQAQYNIAERKMKSKSVSAVKDAQKIFEELGDYLDSSEKARLCADRIPNLKKRNSILSITIFLVSCAFIIGLIKIPSIIMENKIKTLTASAEQEIKEVVEPEIINIFSDFSISDLSNPKRSLSLSDYSSKPLQISLEINANSNEIDEFFDLATADSSDGSIYHVFTALYNYSNDLSSSSLKGSFGDIYLSLSKVTVNSKENSYSFDLLPSEKGICVNGEAFHIWASPTIVSCKRCSLCGLKNNKEPAAIDGTYSALIGNGVFWEYVIDTFNGKYKIYETCSTYRDLVFSGNLSVASENQLNGEGGFVFSLNADGTLNAGSGGKLNAISKISNSTSSRKIFDNTSSSSYSSGSGYSSSSSSSYSVSHSCAICGKNASYEDPYDSGTWYCYDDYLDALAWYLKQY